MLRLGKEPLGRPAGSLLPLVEPIEPAPNAEEVFLRLSVRPHCLFLDSALPDGQLGRYSFVTADPFEFIRSPVEGAAALGQLARRLAPYCLDPERGLPPFQGGAAGLFSYDLGRQLERLPRPAYDEFRLPALAVGLYDVVVAFDHLAQRCWIISTGFPETGRPRLRRAQRRLRRFQAWLAATPVGPDRRPVPESAPIPAGRLAPQFPVAGPEGLTSNLSPPDYLEAVRRAIEYVYAGDVFQVNLAQRLLYPAVEHPVALYLRLRRRNPAPFAGYFDLGDFQVLSASPERFLQLCGGVVQSRPIKGTRPRSARPEVDRLAREELARSQKDWAENVMIVDLLRNDLSRVCEPDSVCVTQLCRVESYQYVHHLVSAIQGQLRPGRSAVDLLRATFPGGSVTGAPKVRAMEIIAQLEPTARGPYCGSLGYIGFDGSMDLNILIRTITAGGGWWQAPVGGGIVAQSDPQREYEETWHKAEGLLRALIP
ncbi:MAG TPA: aminodeoxychorismate synthase component I [Planctomycetes bacterium]|nr:aminodeoxychorismate synthase component I [Planctomycetota bacterium]